MSTFPIAMRSICVFLFLLLPASLCAAPFDRFEGTYTGEAEFTFEGQTQRRDMSTTIKATKTGFTLVWTSVSYKDDGRSKAKTYQISFVPSARENIYTSAMKTNVFGKEVPLDPLKGEPFVWAKLEGDTLSVFSLYIDETGDYEIQEFHRTLVAEGLDLKFHLFKKGAPQKEIRTLLRRKD
ncbi:hypothetical protein [Sulfitobacter sp.]|uniref:hypothetical protein n=1 Tax=Sulfitobacter sp. TaxID=1903071 RepID=UPI00356905BC|tara:strand:+ start:148 stop:690 length:543 start_codon:yes stop_codon:yes gene_type:complete